MFLGRKNQYCENDCTAKCNLQIQCNPYQITNGIFHRTEQKISQFIWKHKRPQIAKAVLRRMELEESSFLTSAYTTKLQSSHSEHGMVLAIRGLLCFHMNYEIFCSSSVKNAIGNLIWTALNL